MKRHTSNDGFYGRFTSVDPLAMKFADLSPYNYAGNKPITKRDIEGLQEEGRSGTPKGGNATHTVQKGDTFWSLEKQNGLTHGTLKSLNPDVDPTKLQIGSSINVPGQQANNLSVSKSSFEDNGLLFPNGLLGHNGNLDRGRSSSPTNSTNPSTYGIETTITIGAQFRYKENNAIDLNLTGFSIDLVKSGFSITSDGKMDVGMTVGTKKSDMMQDSIIDDKMKMENSAGIMVGGIGGSIGQEAHFDANGKPSDFSTFTEKALGMGNLTTSEKTYSNKSGVERTEITSELNYQIKAIIGIELSIYKKSNGQ